MDTRLIPYIEQLSATNLLNTIPNPIAVIDQDLKVRLVNSSLEVLTGMALCDVQGLYVDFVLRSNIAHRGRTFREALTTPDPIVLQGNIVSRDRRKIAMQFTLSPLRDSQDQVLGLVIVLEDLTARSQATEETDDDAINDTIIGQSPKMQEVFELLPLLARTEASVLITGETGTGKDRVAEAIHKRSDRAPKPFIKINCGALPESLLESELFGYVKGAFTGATKDKPGMFRLAQGGTLFLTEIGDMPLPLQVKLLSVLDDREFFPLGAEKKVQVDVRIIAATHRPLKQQVLAGKFREDLYYRLNVLQLHLPALRERDTDTRFLLNHFLRLFAKKSEAEVKAFSSEALEFLMHYPYPGNIRELRNIVEYSVNICQHQQICPEHLPKYLLQTAPLSDLQPTGPQPEENAPPATSDLTKDWNTIEKELIITTLKQTRGNRTRAAEILGWGRTTLWRKLKAHGLIAKNRKEH